MSNRHGTDASRRTTFALPQGNMEDGLKRIARIATCLQRDPGGGHSVEADRWGKPLPNGAPGVTVRMKIGRDQRPVSTIVRDTAFDRLITAAALSPMPAVSCEVCEHAMHQNGPQFQCGSCGHVLQALSRAAA